MQKVPIFRALTQTQMKEKVLQLKHIISNYISLKENNHILNDEQFIEDFQKATTFKEIFGAFADWEIDEHHLTACLEIYFEI